MYGMLAGLDSLYEVFGSTNQRLAVTVAVWGAMVVVLFASRGLQQRLAERTRPIYADVVTTLLLVGTFVLAVAASLGVWGQTERLRELSAEYDLGGEFVATLIVSGVILVSTYIVARFARRVVEELFSSASAVTDHQREITHRLSQVTIWGVAVVLVLGIWVDDLGGLLIGAGFLGIVVGMAARQTLGAMLAGFVLMFDRPFEIGDWVEIEDQEGIVTDISVINTRVQTFDGEYVMVPNDVVGSQMVTNRSKRGHLRVEIDVGIDYDADLERASDLARETVADLEESIEAPAPQVVTKEFGDSAIVLGVRFWIDRPSAARRARARTASIGAIKEAFEEAGIKIPYPQQELSGREETGGFSVRESAKERSGTENRQAGTTPAPEGE